MDQLDPDSLNDSALHEAEEAEEQSWRAVDIAPDENPADEQEAGRGNTDSVDQVIHDHVSKTHSASPGYETEAVAVLGRLRRDIWMLRRRVAHTLRTEVAAASAKLFVTSKLLSRTSQSTQDIHDALDESAFLLQQVNQDCASVLANAQQLLKSFM